MFIFTDKAWEINLLRQRLRAYFFHSALTCSVLDPAYASLQIWQSYLSLWLIAKGIKLFPTLSSANRLHVQHPYKQENSANYKIKKRFMVVNATRNSLNLSSNQVKHGQNSRLFFLTCTTAPSEFRFKCLSIQPPSSCIVEQRSSEHRRASSGSWIP